MVLDKSTFGSHISQQFNEDLETLKSHLLMMGGLVERQVIDAVQSLVEIDSGLAIEVRSNEKKINSYEIAIDEECTRIIALRQPAAGDLRMVIVISKTIIDLERIGDESNKIAQLAIKLSEQGQSPRGCVEVRHIGNHVRQMVHDALDAFARGDVQMALAVAQEDRAVDIEYESAMRQLVTFMMEDPRSITRVLNVVWALRALERIGDHARNIAEHVIYLVKGRDVRHRSLEQIRDQLFEK
jgi:phosphate transport system protein